MLLCGCVFLSVPSTVGSEAPSLLIGLSLLADLEFTAANFMKCNYSFMESVKGRSVICVNESAHIYHQLWKHQKMMMMEILVSPVEVPARSLLAF